MTRATFHLANNIYDYLLNHSLREDPVLCELRAVTALMSTAKMQIAPEEGQLLTFLIKMIGANKTLDIGVFTGYSTLIAAMALPNDGRVIGCDINGDWTNIAHKYWRKADQDHKIDLRLAEAKTTLKQLISEGEAGTFDFIFIDADKKNYDTYYELSLELLSDKGVIAVDNVLQGGRVAEEAHQDETTKVIRQFNKKIYADDRVDIAMIPIADGLTLIRKKA